MADAATPKGDSPAEDTPMYSRTPGRDIFGDLDDKLPDVRVPAHVKVDAMRAAHACGLDLTAFLRLNLYASLYGPEHVATLHEKQLRRVLGNGGQGKPDGSTETAREVRLPTFLKTRSQP